MSRYTNAEDVKKEHLEVLGLKLGPVYHALYDDCAWLHTKWQQYIELYGTKPERIDLLNHAAGLFFRVVQDSLWEDTLLHLARLTDKENSAGKDNLTVRRLPNLIEDVNLRREIQNLVNESINMTEFARDWRNRHIAHYDLNLKIGDNRAKPLAKASRKQVKDALQAVSRIIKRIHEFYFKSDLLFDYTTTSNGAESLLYVIRDGLEFEERRKQRFLDGKIEADDIKLRREI